MAHAHGEPNYLACRCTVPGMEKRGLVLRWTIVIGVVACFMVDLHLTRHYGGIDLRDKVVGSRSLMEGRSLYYNPWRPGDPERLADPMLPPGTAMTRYTGTPFQALLMAPVAALPFGEGRMAWLVIQYALLIGSVLFTARAFGRDDPARQAVVAAVVLLLFVACQSWRLHVERGQVYVLPMAVLALLFVALKARREVATGVLIAVLVLIKPTNAIIAAPLLLVATWRTWAGAAGFTALMAGAFALLAGGLRAWAEYFAAMRAWNSLPDPSEPPVVEGANYTYPSVIEGMAGLDAHHAMEFENGSIPAILHVLGLDIPAWTPWALLVALLLGIVLVAGRRLRRLPAWDLLLLGFCCWVLFMLFLRVPSFDYQVVVWAAPLVVLLLSHGKQPLAWNVLALAAAALLLGALSLLPVNVLLAEAIMLGLVGQVLWKGLRAPSRPLVQAE